MTDDMQTNNGNPYDDLPTDLESFIAAIQAAQAGAQGAMVSVTCLIEYPCLVQRSACQWRSPPETALSRPSSTHCVRDSAA